MESRVASDIPNAVVSPPESNADQGDLEAGAAGAAGECKPLVDWPMMNPPRPRKGRYFCCGNGFGCCPAYIIGLAPAAVLIHLVGYVAIIAAFIAAIVVYTVCGYWCCLGGLWLRSWECAPWDMRSSIYVKLTYLAYQVVLLGRKKPKTSPQGMPTDALRPKEDLVKVPIHYAINIHVPRGTQEEFTSEPIAANLFVQWCEEHMSQMVHTDDDFKPFRPGEDPVKYVMRQLDSVFPTMYQVWEDKQSDVALTRFCLHGLGAHRVETEEIEGVRHFVVRADMLSQIPVRDGFERYGCDAYFDLDWRPVKIVDSGLGPLRNDGTQETVTIRPGDDDWSRAKFRFRSSLSVLVTLVDHLYGAHLQLSNVFVTALREQLAPDHPVRRFMTPFTYQTISVNDNARNNLIQIDAMAPRCFGFTDGGIRMAFACAPKLLMSGLEVPAEEGGPILDRISYAKYLQSKGIDTEYHRQAVKLVKIFYRFIKGYMDYYYPTDEDLLQDTELLAFLRQYLHQLEFVNSSAILTAEKHTDAPALRRLFHTIFAETMYLVTAGHEQVGSVAPYVQDVSFCAFRWTPGATIGTKQTATNQAMLMSFTSTEMPRLLGSDWTHLFPEKQAPPEGVKTPQECFQAFQTQLAEMSQMCDEYDAKAKSRSFPECFPLQVMNPKNLDTSISI